jgi:hypothetical protein
MIQTFEIKGTTDAAKGGKVTERGFILSTAQGCG